MLFARDIMSKPTQPAVFPSAAVSALVDEFEECLDGNVRLRPLFPELGVAIDETDPTKKIHAVKSRNNIRFNKDVAQLFVIKGLLSTIPK